MLVQVVERLHYIDEPAMFLDNVSAGGGKTTLCSRIHNVLSQCS